MRNFLQALDQKHAKLFKKKKESRKSVLTRHQASRDGRLDSFTSNCAGKCSPGHSRFLLVESVRPNTIIGQF
jgi:hypothetical protein